MGLTGIINDTNSRSSVIYKLSEIQSADLKGLNANSMSNWTFVVGPGGDKDGDGLPDVYEELVTRTDPYEGGNEGYDDPDKDGWVNISEMQNGTDPLAPNTPPSPSNVSAQQNINGITKVTWNSSYLPEYFLVEKTDRTLARITNGPPFPPPPSGLNRSNMNEYMQKRRQYLQQYDPHGRPRHPEYITGSPRIVAKIIPNPGQYDFTYTETNATVDPFSNPIYRVQAHVTPMLGVFLDVVNMEVIRKTMVSVTAKSATNGYDLMVPKPTPDAHYLLLVRDRQEPQWKACGYFCAKTNRESIPLRVDRKGMMHDGQRPIAMPEVKFASDLIAPEFVFGWGDDSDGDGLPDIYEVLVTQTDPANPDTGKTGMLDGYKDLDADGITNLEEFRRRTNPRRPDARPASVELTRPSMGELWQAMARERLRTDIRFEPEIMIRKTGEAGFHELDRDMKAPPTFKDPNTLLDFDVRVTWQTPRPAQIESGYHGP
jgi:hypothetical protein